MATFTTGSIAAPSTHGGVMGIADKDYFLNDKGELAQSDEDAATLLVREGQEVPQDMADKYGIGKVAQSGEEADGSVKAATAPENKAKSTAKADKGAK
jgi:hypothetical protein